MTFYVSGVINPISTSIQAQLRVQTTDASYAVIDQKNATMNATVASAISNTTWTSDNYVVQENADYTL